MPAIHHLAGMELSALLLPKDRTTAGRNLVYFSYGNKKYSSNIRKLNLYNTETSYSSNIIMIFFENRCTPGYHGKNCEARVDACYGNPCANTGICKVLEEGRFQCVCPAGYTGLRCETNIDDCFNNSCANNATCIDGKQRSN